MNVDGASKLGGRSRASKRVGELHPSEDDEVTASQAGTNERVLLMMMRGGEGKSILVFLFERMRGVPPSHGGGGRWGNWGMGETLFLKLFRNL